VVYNHKRHGEFKLGGRTFFFHCRHRFPTRLTQEFVLVDLLNNLKDLAEDQNEVLNKVTAKARSMDPKKLRSAVRSYGNSRAKSLLNPLVNKQLNPTYAA
jgi:FPC/CPF motif-containing protein YcgG